RVAKAAQSWRRAVAVFFQVREGHIPGPVLLQVVAVVAQEFPRGLAAVGLHQLRRRRALAAAQERLGQLWFAPPAALDEGVAAPARLLGGAGEALQNAEQGGTGCQPEVAVSGTAVARALGRTVVASEEGRAGQEAGALAWSLRLAFLQPDGVQPLQTSQD